MSVIAVVTNERTGASRRMLLCADSAALLAVLAQSVAAFALPPSCARLCSLHTADDCSGRRATLASDADLRAALRAIPPGSVLSLVFVPADTQRPPEPQCCHQQQQQKRADMVLSALWERRESIAALIPARQLERLAKILEFRAPTDAAAALVAALGSEQVRLEAGRVVAALADAMECTAASGCSPATSCDAAVPAACALEESQWAGAFVEDVTLGGSCALGASQRRIKIWRVRNTGAKAWPAGCRLEQALGERLATPASYELRVPIAEPGKAADVATEIVTPANAGVYETEWRVVDPEGYVVVSGLRLTLNVVAQQLHLQPPTYPAALSAPVAEEEEEQQQQQESGTPVEVLRSLGLSEAKCQVVRQLEGMGFTNLVKILPLVKQHDRIDDVLNRLFD